MRILILPWLLLLSVTACALGPSAAPTVTRTSASAVPLASNPPANLPQSAVEPTAPVAAADALPPIAIAIPALDLDVSVEPMGWRVVETDAGRTTRWVVPEEAAGWHVNSAGAGAAGNVVLSGHQMTGAAVFLPLALGDVQQGQEIWLTAADDTVFVYRVREVSQPIPIAGATAAERERAASYIAPSDTAQLTLITGWPDFTTTHRVFVVAEFVGTLP